MSHEPTEEQIAALRQYAAENGRNWKSALNADWMRASAKINGEHSALLQQIRNEFGPSWLVKFKLAAVLQGAQDLELVDGEGNVRVVMVSPPVDGLPACSPGRHCAHHGDSPHPCCRCGAKFEQLKLCRCGLEYDRAGWEALPFVGVQGDSVEIFEMRNCTCRSTISKLIEDVTEPQRNALIELAEYGAVHPGRSRWGFVNVSTLLALKRRGLLKLQRSPDGGMMGVQNVERRGDGS